MEFTNYRTILEELVRLARDGDNDGLSAYEREGYYLFATDRLVSSPGQSKEMTASGIHFHVTESGMSAYAEGKRLVYSIFNKADFPWSYHLFIVEKPS